MTPKEKAKDLVSKIEESTTFEYQEYAGAHYSTFDLNEDEVIKVACVSINETIEELEYIYTFLTGSHNEDLVHSRIAHWNLVLEQVESREYRK